MTLLTMPALQALVFVLGCALIHAARAHAAALARVLTEAALLLAVLLLVSAAINSAVEATLGGSGPYDAIVALDAP